MPANFNPIPSHEAYKAFGVDVATAVLNESEAVGIPVATEGVLPDLLHKDREALAALDFQGEVGQALRMPQADGPTLVAVGIGKPAELDAAKLREAAAAFGSASARYAYLAFDVRALTSLPDAVAARVIVEGVLLARYRYDALKSEPDTVALKGLVLVASGDRVDALSDGIFRGRTMAAAAALARDLANTPPAYLTARKITEIAVEIAPECGLGVEVFDEKALAKMGFGGLLGVNRGSAEPPRMIELTYRPDASDAELAKAGHLAMVGKGVMYDSGGISLKPSNAMHAVMKVDMSGAGAVLAAMTALKALDCQSRVTAYLVCTDNMPSGTAMALGDVLTIHGGKTVEVMNTDAEGRLIMADALVLATEEGADAIVDVATLTGAALMALGPMTAAVLGNNEALVDQVLAAAKESDEAAWELPLDQRYRKWLDSDTADIKNLGGEFAGAITGALFLEEFVGETPWAHIDIAGTAHTSTDEPWRPKGATGYGARLLIDLALNFTKGDRVIG